MPEPACERCGGAPPVRGERYCKGCKKLVLAELRESGYLTRTGWRPWRPGEAREDQNETKHGADRF
jgi:hypothetical protein